MRKRRQPQLEKFLFITQMRLVHGLNERLAENAWRAWKNRGNA